MYPLIHYVREKKRVNSREKFSNDLIYIFGGERNRVSCKIHKKLKYTLPILGEIVDNHDMNGKFTFLRWKKLTNFGNEDGENQTGRGGLHVNLEHNS